MSPASGVQGLGLVNLGVEAESEEKDANEGDGDEVFVVGDEDEKEGGVEEVEEVQVDEKGMQSMESLDGHGTGNGMV
ncbi:uncharacterized protein STEHIDRAFT_147787 [Stereum hirsutum FP-91666 SS1]|uniref:uncharacterized protein n=1 Tax=Stereum hirsutum (strain FP-91666) TaxID=721885 RepID=UPI0004449D02|nr:uncharacterized protein STEHIDRAFT_147787 [Stereum hirsutum FP-91666 SS1]EIM85323.1 hypothetical protein STEHIDRAFT_147787 [Stereum hirsutum FP-91666 SS1]